MVSRTLFSSTTCNARDLLRTTAAAGYRGECTRLGFDFEVHGSEFESILGERHRYYVSLKVELIREVMSRRSVDPSRLSLLDIGCGTGIAEELLVGCGQRFVGLDTSKSMLKIGNRRRIRVDFLCADALRMPFDDNVFDLSFSFALMHHLKRDQRLRALKEIARVTKPNSYVMTFEHNPANPYVRQMVHRCSVDDGAELVYSAELVHLHREVGLDILGIRYLAFLPKVLSFLGFLERLLHWVPIGGQYMILATKVATLEGVRQPQTMAPRMQHLM